MASTSSNDGIIQSSINISSSLVRSPRRNYYDVFVSFRGKDTRFNFTDHLFAALQRNGIYAFRDDTKLNKGESIAPELLQAIQHSQIFIVVFSKNYASSTWCLRELEHILLHCNQPPKKRVLPVFYDVDPSEVRHQKGTYSEALAKHEQRFQQDSHKVQRWRAALAQVADLSGWDVCHKPESAEIEKIVEEIIKILGCKFSSLPKHLVGIHSPIQELEKHLLLDSLDDVRILGIRGMGGIGKTTLAKALYNKISHQFDVCCFIDDLNKSYRQDGPISAQKQILLQTGGNQPLQTYNSCNISNQIRSRLHRVRALITIDNVDQVKQLENLDREWFGPGSRIIIISRDEHILKEYEADVVYKVQLLNQKDSLQLLSRKAFKLDHVVSSYDRLAFEILDYTKGLPLAIDVLGSFLFDRNISEWESALVRLRERPNKDIMDVLRLSFDGLEEPEQEIFLHIACFFNHYNVEHFTKVLNCCGFQADIGLRVLIDKSLISHGEYTNSVQMHGLLVELGKKIAQEKSRKWSRLWDKEQFYDVKLENMEKKVEVIYYDKRAIDLMIMAETLSKMSHLKVLILRGVGFLGNLNYLSNELRYMEWHNYPFKYFPSSFQPNQLVELILRHSSIKQLWKDKVKKYFPHLRNLDLSHSKNLQKMPDFRDIPNLGRLSFEGCVKLVQMDPSIGVLKKLIFLDLKDCKNLVSIPNNIFGISSLEYVNLSGCHKMFKNHRILNISGNTSHSQSTTSSILKWTAFRYRSLYSRRHKDLACCLLPFLVSFSSLVELDVSFCGLSQLPDAIGCLHWLQELNLGGNNFVTLPSLKELCRLAFLNLEHCKLLESLPQLPFITAMNLDIQKRRRGLFIFNCPKLSERELGSTINYSWMTQFVQANQVFTSVYDAIEFVVPGNEIPSWCNNQSECDSIRIDLSPIMSGNDNNFSGIACCAVFSINPLDMHITIGEGCEIELSINYIGTYRITPIILERDLIEIKLDHMCLIIFPMESILYFLKSVKTLSHIDHSELYCSIRNVKGMDCKVQKCGYHWVSKQDHASLPKLLSSEVQVFGNRR